MVHFVMWPHYWGRPTRESPAAADPPPASGQRDSRVWCVASSSGLSDCDASFADFQRARRSTGGDEPAKNRIRMSSESLREAAEASKAGRSKKRAS